MFFELYGTYANESVSKICSAYGWPGCNFCCRLSGLHSFCCKNEIAILYRQVWPAFSESMQTVEKLFLIQDREWEIKTPSKWWQYWHLSSENKNREKICTRRICTWGKYFLEKDVTKAAKGVFGRSEHIPATKCRGNATEGTKGILYNFHLIKKLTPNLGKLANVVVLIC